MIGHRKGESLRAFCRMPRILYPFLRGLCDCPDFIFDPLLQARVCPRETPPPAALIEITCRITFRIPFSPFQFSLRRACPFHELRFGLQGI
jgi:hypothetical protein